METKPPTESRPIHGGAVGRRRMVGGACLHILAHAPTRTKNYQLRNSATLSKSACCSNTQHCVTHSTLYPQCLTTRIPPPFIPYFPNYFKTTYLSYESYAVSTTRRSTRNQKRKELLLTRDQLIHTHHYLHSASAVVQDVVVELAKVKTFLSKHPFHQKLLF